MIFLFIFVKNLNFFRPDMEQNSKIVVINNVNIFSAADSVPVLYNVSFEISKGEIVYLTGKVGTGKTSIIRTLIAENPVDKGSAEICGFDLRRIKQREIPFLRRKIGVVFQDFALLNDRSVHDNLEFVLRATGWKKTAEIETRIQEVLSDVGMSTKGHYRPVQLSGGEQQRIAIARALLNKPEIILADEPTGNLDFETTDEIMKLLLRLNAEHGTAILMITHNLSLLEKYPARVLVCQNESVEESSSLS